MIKIDHVKARQVFDSRGIPTIEAEIFLKDGGHGRFIAPSGASVGQKEALELRDKDQTKFAGRGVLQAVSHVENKIAHAILEKNFYGQSDFDKLLIELDGTENKSKLGANAILAVSGAFFHALADHFKKPLYRSLKDGGPFILPLPLVNVINGGKHANNALDVQEFMLLPCGAKNFSESMQFIAETFYVLKNILQTRGASIAVGDEGGFAPKLSHNEQALDLLMAAVTKAGFEPGNHIKFALDVAANELYDKSADKYFLNNNLIGRDALLLWYEKLVKNYPICSIEDPFFEEDFIGFSSMMKKLGHRIQIVGDDLFATNEKYIRLGIEKGYANAVLIKMNQIGTITETIDAAKLAKDAGMHVIVSHRSGDSEDTTIADLSVLVGAGQIKTGSISRSERTAKYNRLLRIEEELGVAAAFEPWCG
jgi:enolase